MKPNRLSSFYRQLSLAAVTAAVIFAPTQYELLRADAFDPGDNIAGGATRLSPPSAELQSTGLRTLNTISSNGAQDTADWFIISLEANETYVFTSDDPRSDGDPLITVISALSGVAIAEDDDDGDVGLNFLVVVEPEESGDFYLLVEPYNDDAGDASFSYVMSYYKVGEGGGEPGSGGGVSTGGFLDLAPSDFVTIVGTPIEVTEGPTVAVVSQQAEGNASVALSGTAIPSVDEDTKAEEEIVSVEYRFRHNNQPWTEWTTASGLEDWSFQAGLPQDGFLMYQVRVTDAAGITREITGVER